MSNELTKRHVELRSRGILNSQKRNITIDRCRVMDKLPKDGNKMKFHLIDNNFIKKINWTKIVKYSIKHDNTSIMMSQLQGRPSDLYNYTNV